MRHLSCPDPGFFSPPTPSLHFALIIEFSNFYQGGRRLAKPGLDFHRQLPLSALPGEKRREGREGKGKARNGLVSQRQGTLGKQRRL